MRSCSTRALIPICLEIGFLYSSSVRIGNAGIVASSRWLPLQANRERRRGFRSRALSPLSCPFIPPLLLPTFLLWRPRLATEPRIPSLEFLGSFWPPPPLPNDLSFLSSILSPTPFFPTHTQAQLLRQRVGDDDGAHVLPALGFFCFFLLFFFFFFFNICFFFF